jgi:hypothetical protein
MELVGAELGCGVRVGEEREYLLLCMSIGKYDS